MNDKPYVIPPIAIDEDYFTSAKADIENSNVSKYRLQSISDNEKPIRSSNLPIGDMVLLDELGFDEIGFCAGNCVFRLAKGTSGLGSDSHEMTEVTKLLYNCRESVAESLRAQADFMGADGVIGMNLGIRTLNESENLYEFVATGTAIRAIDRTQSWTGRDGRPFTCNFTANDFYLCLKSGHRPLEMTMGCSVRYIKPRSLGSIIMQTNKNVIMNNFTEAYHEARDTAISRAQDHARAHEANLIIDLKVEERMLFGDRHFFEFLAFGTAVTECDIHKAKPGEMSPVLTMPIAE